ncbi:MAG: adenylate kinase [archaeon]
MKKIFLGPPGSGKGTAASRVAPKFGIPHISTGELFRQNIEQATEIGQKAKEFMDKGLLVPDEIVIEMLKQRIEQEDCKKGFILDGFPRTIPQAEQLSEITEMDLIINMDVTEEVIIERLCSRICCSKCGKIYNLRGMNPKQEGVCDDCEGEIIQRDDDKPKVIQERLRVYRENTEPLIDFYKNKGNIIDIVCANPEQTPDETFQEVINAINKFLEEKAN